MRAEAGMRTIVFCALVSVAAGAWAQATPHSLEERLFEAIDARKELVAEGVLQRGRINLDARNADGETPLHRAVEKGMKEIARQLVAAGSNLRARSKSGETVLHLAALNVEPGITSMLLDAGADPKARNDDGESALHWAALSGHVQVGRLLIERGADPNLADLRGNRPLHAAADSGNIEMVKLVVAAGADPKAKNRDGLNAEEIAIERSRPDIAALLSKAVPRAVTPSGTSNFGTIDIDLQPKERF